MSPFLAGIVAIVGSTFFLMVGDEFAGSGTVDVLALANGLDAVVDIGGDENVDHVLIVAQHIVGCSSYKYAVALIGSLSDGIALKFIQTFL